MIYVLLDKGIKYFIYEGLLYAKNSIHSFIFYLYSGKIFRH